MEATSIWLKISQHLFLLKMVKLNVQMRSILNRILIQLLVPSESLLMENFKHSISILTDPTMIPTNSIFPTTILVLHQAQMLEFIGMSRKG